MSATTKYVLVGAGAFVVGVFAGVELTKAVAKSKVQGGLDSFLGAIGLGGGKVQAAADSFVPSALVD